VPPELYALPRRVPRPDRRGPPTCCDASLPACHGRRTCPPGPIRGGVCCLRGACTPSASATSAGSKRDPPCRGRGPPCGLQEARSTLRPSCAPCVPPRLRHGRKTRYGWGARPDPTGTCPLQETPSLSWRENAGPQPLPEAGATQARTLEAVACRPGLGWDTRPRCAVPFRPPQVLAIVPSDAHAVSEGMPPFPPAA